MNENHVITKSAIEAAARALLREQSNGCHIYHAEGQAKRDDLDRYAEAHARAALKDAAPHMLAGAAEGARASNPHLIEGASDYSAGFHYALNHIQAEPPHDDHDADDDWNAVDQ